MTKPVERLRPLQDLPLPRETEAGLKTLSKQVITAIYRFQTSEAPTLTHSSQVEALLKKIPGIEQFIGANNGEIDVFGLKEALCNPAVISSIANYAALPLSAINRIFDGKPELQPLLGVELGPKKMDEIRWLLRFGHYLRLQVDELRAEGNDAAASGTEADLYNFVLWTSERVFGGLDSELQLLARGIDPSSREAGTIKFTERSHSIISRAVTMSDAPDSEGLRTEVMRLLKGGDLALAKEALQNYTLTPNVRKVMEFILNEQAQNVDLVKARIALAGLIQAYYQAFGITTEQLYASEGVDTAELFPLLTDPNLAQELGTAVRTQAPQSALHATKQINYTTILPERASLLDLSNEPIDATGVKEIVETLLRLFEIDEKNLLLLTSGRPGSTTGAFTIDFTGNSADVTALVLGAHKSTNLFTEVTVHELTHVMHAQALTAEERRCNKPGARFTVPQRVTETMAQTTEHATHQGDISNTTTRDIVNVVRDQMQIRKGIINSWLRHEIERTLNGESRALTASEVEKIHVKLTVQLANPAMTSLVVAIDDKVVLLRLPNGFFGPFNYFNPLNPTDGAHYSPNYAIDLGPEFVKKYGSNWLYQPEALAILSQLMTETLHRENHDVTKYRDRVRALIAESEAKV